MMSNTLTLCSRRVPRRRSGLKLAFFQRGGMSDIAALDREARRVLPLLMSTRMLNLLSIRVELRATKLASGENGCMFIHQNGSDAAREFRVIIDRDKGLAEQKRILRHELKHVEQQASGRLQYRRWKSDHSFLHARWDGKEMGRYESLPYWNRPWEVDARTAERL